MQRLTQQIMEHAERLPEGMPIAAKALLHLGSRAAVDQALSRLVRRGRLLRARRGLYLLPVETRFGIRAPSAEKVVEAIASQRGETVTPNGAAAANALGLTSQVPVRAVYLTSGPSCKLKLGAQVIEMRHAPNWQLARANRPAGEAVRALAWLGPTRADQAVRALKRKLPESELTEIISTCPVLPTWIAKSVSKLVAHG